MAGSSEVLQEYLVKLGFKTDSIQLRKFEDGLGKTGKRILGVGTAAATAVVAVEAAAAAFAYSMRNTYFQSQLAGTSARNLKAMAFAGRQVGISADAMGASIHGMAQAMRLNPALQGLVESFGIKVTGRDTADVMMDYVKALNQMPEWNAAQFAQMFGIDPDTYHQMRENMEALTKAKKENFELFSKYGVDQEKADKAALHYAGTLDRLSESLKVLGGSMMISLMPVFDTLAKKTEQLIEGWTRLFNGELFNPQKGSRLYDLYKKFGIDTGDKEATATPKGSREQSGKIKQGGTGAPAGMSAEEIRERNRQIMEGGTGAPAGESATSKLPLPVNKTAPVPSSPAGKASSKGSAAEAVTSLMEDGWTREQAIGIAANLRHESNFNAQAVGDSGKALGIAQWHPDRQADFAKWAGKEMKDSSFAEQMKFVSHELRQGKEQRAGKMIASATTAEDAARITSKYYERPADVAGEMEARAGTAARLGSTKLAEAASQVTQTNTININGNVSDANLKQIEEFNRKNADILRNMRGRTA